MYNLNDDQKKRLINGIQATFAIPFVRTSFGKLFLHTQKTFQLLIHLRISEVNVFLM